MIFKINDEEKTANFKHIHERVPERTAPGELGHVLCSRTAAYRGIRYCYALCKCAIHEIRPQIMAVFSEKRRRLFTFITFFDGLESCFSKFRRDSCGEVVFSVKSLKLNSYFRVSETRRSALKQYTFAARIQIEFLISYLKSTISVYTN